MLTPETRTIGSYTYTTTKLGALKGTEILARLAVNATPLMIAAHGGNVAAIARSVESLKPEMITELCTTFAAVSTVKIGTNEPRLDAVFDVHFAGNYLELFEWLTWCLEVNFRSFFVGAAAKMGARLVAEKALTSASPTGATG